MTAIRRLRLPGFSRRPRITHLLSTRLGTTRGQASTLLVALALAGVLALGGLPPVLRRGPVAPASLLAAPAPASTPAATSAPPAAGGSITAPAAEVLPSSPSSLTPFATPSGSFTPSGGSGSFTPGAGSGEPGGSSSFDTTSDPAPEGDSGAGSGPRTSSLVASVPGAAGIAVAGDRVVVASNESGAAPKIVVLGADGSVVRAHAVGDRPANASAGLTGVAVDDDSALVGDAATGRVLRIALATGAQRVYTELADLPACGLVVAANAGCEPGVRDDKPSPAGLARASDGTLFVADAGQGAIWKVPPGGGRPVVVTTDIAFSNGVSGIAVAADGSLLVAAPEAVDPQAAGGGAVYRVTAAGGKSMLARFPRGSLPSGVAVAAGRGIVVSLRGAGAVVLLGETGQETRRAAGKVGEATLAAPAAVAVGADGIFVSDGDSVLILTEL